MIPAKKLGMKTKQLLFLVCSLLLLSSCTFNLGFKRISPSTNIVEKELPQSAFDKINISAMANIKYVQGETDNYRVVISAPDNYLDLFRINVNEGKLMIDFEQENIEIETKNVNILIYAPTLNELSNSGIAEVKVDSLQADVLLLENSGVGSLLLDNVRLSQLDVQCSGVGNIKLSGEVDCAKMDCSGVGNIDARQLLARTVTGAVSGVGDISCYVTDSLEANVNGVGSLKYTGDPQYKKLNSTGVGSIQQQ